MSAHKLEWQALWDAMEAAPDAWIPTTENMWWQMLEVLPPRAQTRGAFLVGELFARIGDFEHAIYALIDAIEDGDPQKIATVTLNVKELLP